MDEFKVTIDKFSGPLDLMLHLIHEKKLDLMDLDVNELAIQYIAYLNSMEQMHLEIAGDYLAELAGLLEYKSKQLLPKDPAKADEETDDEKDRLVQRLLEYQQYKEVAADLGTLFESRQQQMGRPLSNEVEQWLKMDDSQVHYKGNAYDLMKAMRRVLMRVQLNRPVETKYTVKEVSMEDRELVLRAKMEHLPSVFQFDALLDDVHDLDLYIATFLAVLDLARQRKLLFTIDEESQEVFFTKGDLFA